MARTRDGYAIVFGILVFRSRAVREPIAGGCGSDHGRITARPGKPDFRPGFARRYGLSRFAGFGGSLRNYGYRLEPFPFRCN